MFMGYSSHIYGIIYGMFMGYVKQLGHDIMILGYVPKISWACPEKNIASGKGP